MPILGDELFSAITIIVILIGSGMTVFLFFVLFLCTVCYIRQIYKRIARIRKKRTQLNTHPS
jgi:hypothetical protein